MKLTALLLSTALVSTVYADGFERRSGKSCNPGNNCQRAVGGINRQDPPLSSRLADCSSLNVATVIPPTVTVPPASTATVTKRAALLFAIPTAKKRAPHEKRQSEIATSTTILPTAVPTYASACTTGGTAVAYYSACSCAGVTQSTTTLPAPTVTGDPDPVCPAKRAVRRGLEFAGYEVPEGFDAVKYDGIELFRI